MSKASHGAEWYRVRARGLKDLGMIDYDLRRPLSPQQKAAITRISERWNDIGVKPYAYMTQPLAGRDPQRFKVAGLPTYKDKRTGTTRARVKLPQGTQTATIRGRGAKRELFIKESGGVTQRWFLDVTVRDFLARLETKPELKQNELLTVRIGNNAPFRMIQEGPKGLQNYLRNWQPKGGTKRGRAKLKRDLIAQMGVVEITPTFRQKGESHGKKGKKASRTRSRNRSV